MSGIDVARMFVMGGVQSRGFVELYPQDTEGKKTSASFRYNATRNLERCG